MTFLSARGARRPAARYAATSLVPYPLAGALVGAALAWPPAAARAQTTPARPPAAQPPAGAHAHGHPHAALRGTVRDSAGRPVAAARVQLVELHREYLTHGDGTFVFADVPPGRYTLEARRLGFRPATRAAAVRDDGADAADLTLVASAAQLSEVVVTGTVAARARQDVLSPTSTLSDAALDRRLDGTLGQTLQGLPGVSLASMGPATARPVIRGLGGDRIVILEDGQRPGDLSSTSPDHAVAIDPLTARRVEVVRGPMSLLYGSSALGGVVNVVRDEVPTALPEHGHGTVVAQATSANRGATAGVTYADRVGPVAVRAEGSSRTGQDLRTPLGPLVNTGVRAYNAAAGAALVGHDGHAGVAYRFYDNRYGIPGGFVGAHPGGVDVQMRRHTTRLEGELHEHTGPFASVRGAATFTDYAHEEREPSGGLGTWFGQRFAQGEVVARHDTLGRLATGAVGVRAQFRDVRTGGTLRTPSTRDWSLAAFAVEEVGLGPVRLQGGARYDVARYTPLRRRFVNVGDTRIPTEPRAFGSASGSLGLLWAPRPWLSAGATASRAYRTPDFNELYSDGPHLAAYSYDVGNPRLGAEAGLGTDAFVRVARGGVRAEVAAFRNAMRGYVFPRNTGEVGRQQGRPLFQFTGADAVLRGAEAELEWSVTPRLVVDGSASYVTGRLVGRPDSVPALDGRPARAGSPWLPLMPPPNARLAVRYERPRWFLGAGGRFTARQDRLGDFETPTAAYALADLSAGVRLLVGARLHTLTLRADNLLDAVYREHLARTKAVMPEAGRNLSLLYRVSF
jgi:iron complex outermembrane receptor protein